MFFFFRNNPKKWDIDKEIKPKIDNDLADFIIEHAINSLKQTTETSDAATNRAYAILVVMIPITSTIIGLLIDTLSKKPVNYKNIAIFYSVIGFISLVILGILFQLIFPRNTMFNGRAPKDIVKLHMFQNEYTAEEKLRMFKLNEIKNLQYKIDYNNSQNHQRIKLFKLTLSILFITFLGGIVCYFKLV